MKNTLSKRFLILLSLFVYGSSSYALETETHKAINKYVAQNTLNNFSLDSYLKNNLGLTKGKEEEFTSGKTRKVFEWIEIGGEYEDSPIILRPVNHFHNPITKQGYNGLWWLFWGGFGYLNGASSLQWAQEDIGTQSPGGYYSWKDTRQYFYTALTGRDYGGNPIALTKEQRDTYFASTFRGLGQLMHLVEDLSVPEHTRNDGHAPCWLWYNYECWVDKNQGVISQYTPIYFDPSAIGNINPLASVPIANLFDTNQYDGTHPNVTLQSNIGLSEYTNANFMSPGTYFTLPYPNLESIVEFEETDQVSGKKRTYLKKLGQGDTEGDAIGNGEHINHLALTGRMYKLLPAALKKRALRPVYTDYAQKLIPHAVGYSAGLLNYFFRGQIDMAPDPNSPGNYIIENNGNEAINANDGVFTLYYDGTDDQRHQINWSFPSDGRISVPAADANGPGKSASVSFYAPTDAKEPGKYILVFKGTLGNEQNIAVVGKEVKVAEEFLYVLNGSYYDSTQRTRELNITNGDIIWEMSSDGWWDAYAGPASFPLSASDNSVYVNATWNIVKYDSKGNLLWTSPQLPGAVASVKSGKWGIAALCAWYSDTYMVKLDDATGAILWSNKISNDDYSSFDEVWDFATIDGVNFYVSGRDFNAAWYWYPAIYKITESSKTLIFSEPDAGIAGVGKWYWVMTADETGIYYSKEHDIYPNNSTSYLVKRDFNGLLIWENTLYVGSGSWPTTLTFGYDGKSIHCAYQDVVSNQWGQFIIKKIDVQTGGLLAALTRNGPSLTASESLAIADTSRGLFVSSINPNWIELVQMAEGQKEETVIWHKDGIEIKGAASVYKK